MDREGSCNHNLWIPKKYSHLIHGYNVGPVPKKFSSQEFALLGEDGKYHDFREDKLKTTGDNFLTLKHNKGIGRFVVFGDRDQVKWKKAKVLKKFKSSCVKPPKNLLLEKPGKEEIKYAGIDTKKIGKLEKTEIIYYEVDGIPEKVFFAKYEYHGLGYVWQSGLVKGENCTLLNEFQDSGELKGWGKGGVNTQEFHGLMEIGYKEKWLVFEAEGWEWWGYSMIPYNGGKAVEKEKRESVFYDGL